MYNEGTLFSSVRERNVFLVVFVVECVLLGALTLQLAYHYAYPYVFNVSPLIRDMFVFSTSSPRGFYELQPGDQRFDASWQPIPITYAITEDGLNDRFLYSKTKDDSTYRFLVLGDSYTFGLGVEQHENYTEVLEDMLNERATCLRARHYDVINLGVAGYDIRYAVERFEKRGASYAPDAVIWYLKTDDFREVNPKLAESYLDPRSVLAFQQDPGRAMWRTIHAYFSDENAARQIFEYEAAALDWFAQLYAGPLVIVKGYLNREELAVIDGFAARRGNTLFFDAPPFANEKLADGHPNARAHAELAARLFTFIRESEIFPCKGAPGL